MSSVSGNCCSPDKRRERNWTETNESTRACLWLCEILKRYWSCWDFCNDPLAETESLHSCRLECSVEAENTFRYAKQNSTQGRLSVPIWHRSNQFILFISRMRCILTTNVNIISTTIVVLRRNDFRNGMGIFMTHWDCTRDNLGTIKSSWVVLAGTSGEAEHKSKETLQNTFFRMFHCCACLLFRWPGQISLVVFSLFAVFLGRYPVCSLFEHGTNGFCKEPCRSQTLPEKPDAV